MSKHIKDNVQFNDDEDIKVYRGNKRSSSSNNKQRSQAYRQEESYREIRPAKRQPSRHRAPKRKEFSPKALRLPLLSAALLILVWALPTEGWIRLGSFAIPWLLAGTDLVISGLERLFNKRSLGYELVVVIGSIAAFAVGDPLGSVIAVLALRFTEIFDSYAAGRSHRQMSQLMEIRPSSANVDTAEGVLNVEPDYVNPGDVIVVDPGETIPLDGRIIEGITAIDSSVLTGRTDPIAVSPGSRAVSGCRNITSQIKVQVTSRWEDSTVNRILDMVQAAPGSVPIIERYSRRFSKYFPPVLFLLGLAMALVPGFTSGDWAKGISKAAAMLSAGGTGCFVISSVGSYMSGLCYAMKNGIMIKGFDSMEALGETDTMVFGKTGIVTEGRISITQVCPEGMDEDELLAIAATAETGSHHPIARALRQVSPGLQLAPGSFPEVVSIPGRGVAAMIGDKQVLVGNAALLQDYGIGYQVPKRSGAAIHVAVDGTYCGHIFISDRIKRGAFDALEGLRVSGVKKMVLLTGDVLSAARPIASKLNFDLLKAELTQEDKENAVLYLKNNKGGAGKLAFVGEGMNDSDVLELADVGVTMGALESPSAIDAGDVVLMDDDIGKLPVAVRTARLTQITAKTSAAVALGAKILVIGAAALGFIPVSAAALVDAGVHILAVANSLRAGKLIGKE